MTVRTTREKTSTKKAAIDGMPGDAIARSARVEELRRMVASGRYKVEPYRLALRILAKALKKDGA
jgi:anti-sigma28 factor (negative regulator of flagellin synthesis)